MRTFGLLLLLPLTACGPAEIEDIVWRPNAEAVPAAYVLFTSDGRFQASDGCNLSRSTFTREGDAVAVEPGQWTEVACGSAPTAFLSYVFDAGLRPGRGDGSLTLTAQDGTHQLTAPEPDPATKHELDGTWVVLSSTYPQSTTLVSQRLQFLGRTFTLAESREGVVGFSDARVAFIWTTTVGATTLTPAQEALLASTAWSMRDGKLVFTSGSSEFVLGR